MHVHVKMFASVRVTNCSTSTETTISHIQHKHQHANQTKVTKNDTINYNDYEEFKLQTQQLHQRTQSKLFRNTTFTQHHFWRSTKSLSLTRTL